MAVLYILAGLNHFRMPKFYLKITPPWVPAPEKINQLVGIIEILLGVGLLIPSLTSYAAWGIIALLIAIFPANVYHFQKAKKKGKVVWPTLVRLPFQALLIYWAYMFV
ncbi:MAG: membrane protein [Saprospiraceae bacterium]|nr:MAG: membrane protein [Saprospiraceae bacterium]